MALFESTLILLLVAIALLQVSRRLAVPYPTMLAMAGVAVAALPWTPDIAIDPHLAMALFIAPALLDAAYDFPPQALRRFWVPLLALAAVAVVLTTAAVAWAAVAWAGLPLYAAIALGAIVSPPDAAAASAMMARFTLPRSTVTVLKGESLLNDATALLIYGAAVGSASTGQSLSHFVPLLFLAIPGGLLLGFVFGKIALWVGRRLAGTLGGILFGFVATFGAWAIADRLHLSAILCLVAFAMTIARYGPERQSARDRLHANAVWETCVFVLNVLAFLLVGMQARAIISMLDQGQLWDAVRFACGVFAIVVVVRIAWVMLYNRGIQYFYRWLHQPSPSLAQGVVASWCGMRGLVTLATALALPADFAGRNLIVLSALAVVLGTLVVQGLTLGPLIRLLGFAPDNSYDKELSSARVLLLDAAIDALQNETDEAAKSLSKAYQTKRDQAADGPNPHDNFHAHAQAVRRGLVAQRAKLAELRRSSKVDDEVFHELEEELDRAELAASPDERFELLEG